MKSELPILVSFPPKLGEVPSKKAYLKENQTKAPQAIWLGVGMDCKTFIDTQQFFAQFLIPVAKKSMFESRTNAHVSALILCS